MDPTLIKAAINQVMPFGKYAGRRLFNPIWSGFTSKAFQKTSLVNSSL